MKKEYTVYGVDFALPKGTTAKALKKLSAAYASGAHGGGDEILALIDEGLRAAGIQHDDKEHVLRLLGHEFLPLFEPTGPVAVPLFAEIGQRFPGRILPLSATPVANATAGVVVSLLAHNVAGGEVILPSLHAPGQPNAVLMAGATPRFVDIRAENLHLDLDAVDAALTDRTRAIILVHMNQSCDIAPLHALLARRHLAIPVIQDASTALGSTLANVPVGLLNIGTDGTTVFSFATPKTITGLGGGMVVTNSESLTNRIYIIAYHGLNLQQQTHVAELGTNFRMHECCAAIIRAQLRRRKAIFARRRALRETYDRALQPFVAAGKLSIPRVAETAIPAHYMVLLPNRDRVALQLKPRGIHLGFWPAHHLQPFYQSRFGCRAGTLPVTERIAPAFTFLPFHGGLTEDDIATICNILDEVLPSP